MKRATAIAITCLFGVLATAYAVDYVVLRIRLAAKQNALGSVTVSSYYAVQEKNNKTEYVFKGQEEETCVHSLFPHLGYTPCWYLTRHPEQQITI